MDNIILQKGEEIHFLDYTIKNSQNNDGLVLMKPNGEMYETHLGNFGEGTEENVEKCKRYAVLYFMIARPAVFSHCIVRKITNGENSGSVNEFFLLKRAIEKEGLHMPTEITGSEYMNLIRFNGGSL